MACAVGSKHLFSLFGQLGTDISLAPAQQVGGNQVTQHNSTLVGRGHLQHRIGACFSQLHTSPSGNHFSTQSADAEQRVACELPTFHMPRGLKDCQGGVSGGGQGVARDCQRGNPGGIKDRP